MLKRARFFVILISIIAALVFVEVGNISHTRANELAAAQAAPPLAQYDELDRPLQGLDDTLDVCLEYEPPTLYLYGGPPLASIYVLSAIYDGPIDNLSYTFQPVILQRIPTLENGGALLSKVSVSEGEKVVNDANEVVTLTPGQVIRPAGCRDSSCAVTYAGGAVEMDRFQVAFDLLPGLTWSDGQPLTASDSVFSFDLAADPDTPPSWTINAYGIQRTASYVASTATQAAWVGLPGFTPSDYFKYFWTPLPEHAWGSYSAAELPDAAISSRQPLGWGPYLISDWIEGDRIVLHKNPNYFRAGEGLPAFDTLIYHISSDPLQDLLSGVCDVLPSTTVDLSRLEEYDNQGLLKLNYVTSATWDHLDFGILPADAYTGYAGDTLAFQDVNVRRAFAYCLDRQAIADDLFNNHGVTLNTFIPNDHPYYPADAALYPFDPAEGRRLLSNAGWIDSNGDGVRDKNGVEFSVKLVTTYTQKRVAMTEAIASQMLANCGILVEPTLGTYGEVLGTGWPDGPIFGRNFDLAEFGWVAGSIPNCEYYQTKNIPSDLNPGGQNNPGYSSAAYDNACDNARSSIYEADRVAYFNQAAKIFSQDLPVLPLYADLNVSVVAPHITEYALDSTEFWFWLVEEIKTGETAAVPASGGALASPEDSTDYLFGADTFTENVTVTHVTVSPVQFSGFGDLGGVGHYFENYALNGSEQAVQPTQPYSLTLEYTDPELGRIMESTLGLYYWDGSQWVLEETAQVDPNTNTIHANPDRFSRWAVLGEPYKIIFLPLAPR